MHAIEILFVDDQLSVREIVQEYLTGQGYAVTVAESGEAALALLEKRHFDTVFSDLVMPGMSGIDVLRTVKQHSPNTEVVILTGHGTVETAVEALKLGCYDYIQKPIKLERLRLLAERIDEKRRLQLENRALRNRLEEHRRFRCQQLVGVSPKMQRIYDLIDRVSGNDSPVLILGESGTGKEVAATVIHAQSRRGQAPFIAVNCGAIVEGLLESELFGHVKGAFTGAFQDKIGLFRAADGGTLFLDEISEIAPMLQVKLLRVLQEKKVRPVGDSREIKVDVRVIAAANRDLERAVAEGRFRQDLFYRLNVVSIHMPALVERKEDIPLLIQHFLDKFNVLAAHQVTGVAPAAMDRLLNYPWPGNVRQLENVIERAFALEVDGVLQDGDLPPEIRREAALPAEFAPACLDLKTNEIHLIRLALKAAHGNRAQAAKILGVNITTVYRKIEKYRLEELAQRPGAAAPGEV